MIVIFLKEQLLVHTNSCFSSSFLRPYIFYPSFILFHRRSTSFSSDCKKLTYNQAGSILLLFWKRKWEKERVTAKPVGTGSPAWKAEVIEANGAAVIFWRHVLVIISCILNLPFPLSLSLLAFLHLHFAIHQLLHFFPGFYIIPHIHLTKRYSLEIVAHAIPIPIASINDLRYSPSSPAASIPYTGANIIDCWYFINGHCIFKKIFLVFEGIANKTA